MFVRIISATKAEHVKVFHAGISRLILFPMMTVSGSMKPSSSASGSDLPITVSHGRINLMSRVFHRKTFFSEKIGRHFWVFLYSWTEQTQVNNRIGFVFLKLWLLRPLWAASSEVADLHGFKYSSIQTYNLLIMWCGLNHWKTNNPS